MHKKKKEKLGSEENLVVQWEWGSPADEENLNQTYGCIYFIKMWLNEPMVRTSPLE